MDIYRLYALAQRAYSALPYRFGGGRALPPLRYMIHFTLKCNLNCSFCFITGRSRTEEMSTAEWLRVIGGMTPSSVLTISGGEITLLPDFPLLLEACLRKGKVNFLTNGTRLTDDLIRACVEGKVFMVGVSLDGMRERHDALRGKAGTFDRVVAGLERLRELRGGRKYPLLDIKAVLLEDNLEDLPELYRLADRAGAEFLSLSFLKGCDLQFSPVVSEEWAPERWLTPCPPRAGFDLERFAGAYRELLRLSASGRTRVRLNPMFGAQRGERELATIRSFFTRGQGLPMASVYHPCRTPWVDMCIFPDGDVVPCISYRVGNLREESLREVWNGERMRAFRLLLRKHGILGACQTCCYGRVRESAFPA